MPCIPHDEMEAVASDSEWGDSPHYPAGIAPNSGFPTRCALYFSLEYRGSGELGVPGNSLLDVQFPATVALAAIAALGYLASQARNWGNQFTLFDGLILVALMAIVTAAGIPVVDALSGGAKESAMLRNLRTMRATIELYKAEHGGEVPLLYRGTLPQLTKATNASGKPGPGGSQYPLGPYLPAGIPANPSTGIAFITPTDVFPPVKPSGVGGWLYHQPTGRIAADMEEHLTD